MRIRLFFTEVQAFQVWEKDAKDESDFVGYCYLDLFPRGMKYIYFHSIYLILIQSHSQQIFACRCLAYSTGIRPP